MYYFVKCNTKLSPAKSNFNDPWHKKKVVGIVSKCLHVIFSEPVVFTLYWWKITLQWVCERGWGVSVRLIQALDSQHWQQDWVLLWVSGRNMLLCLQLFLRSTQLPKAMVFNIKSSYRVDDCSLPGSRLCCTTKRVEAGSYLCPVLGVSCHPILYAKVKQQYSVSFLYSPSGMLLPIKCWSHRLMWSAQ